MNQILIYISLILVLVVSVFADCNGDVITEDGTDLMIETRDNTNILLLPNGDTTLRANEFGVIVGRGAGLIQPDEFSLETTEDLLMRGDIFRILKKDKTPIIQITNEQQNGKIKTSQKMLSFFNFDLEVFALYGDGTIEAFKQIITPKLTVNNRNGLTGEYFNGFCTMSFEQGIMYKTNCKKMK